MLDDGTMFKIRPADLRALAVTPGGAVGETLRSQLLERDAAARAMEIAHRLLAVRLRSRHELAQRLRRRGIPADIADDVLSELLHRGLIDDERFAEAWVRGRLAVHPSGAARLRRELLSKGVSREVVDRAVASEMFDRGESELTLALALARRRCARYRGLPRQVAYRRLGGLLQRRGFSAAVIAQVLRTILDPLSSEMLVSSDG